VREKVKNIKQKLELLAVSGIGDENIFFFSGQSK
jgi:hypothetical protein